MKIAFTGASATGKSWAAGKLAASLTSNYIPSKASQIAKDMGFDVNQPHDFSDRLKYHQFIVNQMMNDMIVFDDYVTDRSPIDVAAYTIMADGEGQNLSSVDSFCDLSVKITDAFYDVIVLISPPYEQLKENGEHKEGRLSGEIHGFDHRVVFDATVKILLQDKRLINKVLVVPEDCHYEDRISFIKERLKEYGFKY